MYNRMRWQTFVFLCLVAISICIAALTNDLGNKEVKRESKMAALQEIVSKMEIPAEDLHVMRQEIVETKGARNHLQRSMCITELKIDSMTGDLNGAGFDPYYQYGKPHYIDLKLKSDEIVRGSIKGPTHQNTPYIVELSLDKDFTPNDKCVAVSQIKEVTLVAGGRDGWYISFIETYSKVGSGPYQLLTANPIFKKWLDGDESGSYPYDATKHNLTLVTEDRPKCGFGIEVCECRPDVAICVFNLEIDEIRTFTSYRKFSVADSDGIFVRGTQGVIYYINETTGLPKPHPAYEQRTCALFNSTTCSDPQFVDGKTYRMAIGVNGQIPGPTLIVHDQQLVVIHVHNNLSTEGISIHWHGMHQTGTPWMDGVGQVTQCQIGPSSEFTYLYRASPSGTFWYHSHSGAQRTDGFFGALIVKERPDRLEKIKSELNVGNFLDLPGKHTLTLLDWQKEASLDLFSQLNAGLGFFEEADIGEIPDPTHERYESTRSSDRAEVGPVPYFSGLINGKGRHNGVPYAKTRLSVFAVERNKTYRFRLIGAQGLYAYKFSIDGHKLIVVNTDGYWIKPVQVDFIIIHTGERYDFILEANGNVEIENYWIKAETLEIDQNGSGPPYKSLGHVAEGILQYTNGGTVPAIPSTEYEMIKKNSPPISCTIDRLCLALNCPFLRFHDDYYTVCINVHQLDLLEATPSSQLPMATPSPNCPDCQHFINFNFEGDSETSSVNGRNFVFPPVPPQTQNEDFQKQAVQCNLNEDCNPSTLNCLCTHIITIPYNKTVQLVLTAIGAYDNAHPIHLHGHSFHVVHVGYPEYDSETGFIKQEGGNSVHNEDILCSDSCAGKPSDSGCNDRRCTKPGWSGEPPSFTINSWTIRKDTVMVPAGGYVVINFISDNPGHWFLHCHIEVHQLEGMGLIVNEAFDQQVSLEPPESMNKCGDFVLSLEQSEQLKKISVSIQNVTASRSTSLDHIKLLTRQHKTV